MIGNHAAEEIGRDAAHKPCWCAKTRHADGDVEAGTSGNRHGRIAPVHGFDRQEINQGISATQQHCSHSSNQRRRSMRSLHRIAALAIQSPHQSMDPPLRPVEVGHSGRRRFAQTTDRRHRGHCLSDRSVTTAGDGTQHGGPKQDRLLRFRHRNRQAGRIRHDLANQRTSSRAAADHHQVAVDTMRPESVNDIGKAVGQAAQSRHEQPLHRTDIDVKIHPGDDRARIRIGEGRTVAEKFRQDMDIAGKQRRRAQVFRARDDAAFKKFAESRCRQPAQPRGSLYAGWDRMR